MTLSRNVVTGLVLAGLIGFTPVALAAESPLASFFEQAKVARALQKARQHLWEAGESSIQLAPLGSVREGAVESVRFQHFMNGIPVVGGLTVVESGFSGEEGVVLHSPRFEINTTPTLTEREALRVASSEMNHALEGATSTLKILPEDDRSGARLIYWVDYPTSLDGAGGELIIDAHSGDLIAKMTKFRTIAPVDVYTAKNQGQAFTVHRERDILGRMVPKKCTVVDLSTSEKKQVSIEACAELLKRDRVQSLCQLVDAEGGTPLTVNATACKAEVKNLVPVSDTISASARRAADNSKRILEYYLTTHRRNSFDGNGAAAKSLVSVGIDHSNAAWVSDMGLMMYGEGDGKTFGDFTTSVDVAGHEMTHGVISRTAKFINRGESGALDEGFADFFGLMIAGDDSWVMGKGIFLDSSQKGIRDLADPGSIQHRFLDEKGKRVKKPMPKHVREQFSSFGRTCGEENDRCYVHGNATILGHALYQMAQIMGKERAEKITYQGMTRYLSESSNFKDAATALKRACAGLYNTKTCEGVKQAFSIVGL